MFQTPQTPDSQRFQRDMNDLKKQGQRLDDRFNQSRQQPTTNSFTPPQTAIQQLVSSTVTTLNGIASQNVLSGPNIPKIKDGNDLDGLNIDDIDPADLDPTKPGLDSRLSDVIQQFSTPPPSSGVVANGVKAVSSTAPIVWDVTGAPAKMTDNVVADVTKLNAAIDAGSHLYGIYQGNMNGDSQQLADNVQGVIESVASISTAASAVINGRDLLDNLRNPSTSTALDTFVNGAAMGAALSKNKQAMMVTTLGQAVYNTAKDTDWQGLPAHLADEAHDQDFGAFGPDLGRATGTRPKIR